MFFSRLELVVASQRLQDFWHELDVLVVVQAEDAQSGFKHIHHVLAWSGLAQQTAAIGKHGDMRPREMLSHQSYHSDVVWMHGWFTAHGEADATVPSKICDLLQHSLEYFLGHELVVTSW